MKVHEYYATGGANNSMSTQQNSNYFKPGETAEVIALANEGREVPSNFAPFKQIEFELKDGRKWYASLTVAQKVKNAAPNVGDPFRVCKQEYATGKSSICVYSVNAGQPRMESPTPIRKVEGVSAASQPGMEAPTDSQTANHQNTGHANLTAQQLIEKFPKGDLMTALSMVLMPERPSNGRSNGNGSGGNNGSNGNTPNPKPAPASLMNGTGQGRLSYFTAAVDLVIAVEKYAALAGRELRFTAEDVRCIANSWCIDVSKAQQGGR